jgi:hypothetical protein
MGFNLIGKVVGENITTITDSVLTENFLGGALIGFIFMIVIGLVIGVYIYHALAWYIIAKKLKHKNPWLAWIPFASAAMRLQLGKFNWALIFLVLIPFFGWIALFVLLIIAHWRIFEKRKYPGWFSLSMIIPEIGGILFLIIIGFVAWKDRRKMLFD